MKSKPLDPKAAQAALENDLANIVARAKRGEPLTHFQRRILESHLGGQSTGASGATYAKNQTELGRLLGLSRQMVSVLSESPDAPKAALDGRLNVADWQRFIASRGTGGAKDLTDARLRGEQLDNMRKEFRLAALQREYIPKAEVFRVCAQAIAAAKTRSFSGLPRLVTLTRLAKDDESALKSAREEMISVWRSMESCDWFKPSESPSK